MPDATKRALVDDSAGGESFARRRRKPDGDWPSLDTVSDDELLHPTSTALPPDVSFSPATPAIGFVHRRLLDADMYFLANTSNVGRTVRARFSSRSPHAELWDPMTGAVERLDQAGASLLADIRAAWLERGRLQKGGGAAPAAAPVRHARAIARAEIGLDVVRSADEARGPIDLPHSWADDASTRYFSGAATVTGDRWMFRPTFRVPGARVLVDFGRGQRRGARALPGGTMRGNPFAALIAPPIREAATVFVNDRRAGSIWAPPYRVDVTDLAARRRERAPDRVC